MSYVDDRLSKWLQGLAEDITEQGAIGLIEAHHATEGSAQGVLVEHWQVDQGTLELQEFAQKVWDVCEYDASQRPSGMAQRYVLLAYRGENRQYDRRFPFTIRGVGIERSLMDDSTPPNEMGITGQLLRHDIEKDRLLMLLSGAHAERSERTIQRLMQENEQLHSASLRNAVIREDLLDRKAERELKQQVELQKAKRFDDMTGLVIERLFPLVVAKLTGGMQIGNSPEAILRDAAIGNVLKNLTPPELEAIFMNLKQENQIAFLELYKSYREEDAKKQSGKQPLLRDEGGKAAN